MQVVINGCITGLALSVVALSFTIVYLPTRVFHLALGAIFIIVPYIVWAGVNAGLPQTFMVVCALLAGTALSLLCELLNHHRLSRIGVSASAHLISSLGIYIVLNQLVFMKWGSDPHTIRSGVSSLIPFFGVSVTPPQAASAIFSVLILVAFFLWLRFVKKGVLFRALADNPAEVAILGYNIDRVRLLAFGLSGLLCSCGSLLLAYDKGFSPYGGLTAILLAVVAMIIGGRATFIGPVAGGLILGLLREETAYLLATRWQDLLTFLLLALFLLLRPSGLITHKGRIESQP